MLDPARYFDHAATTPLAPEVLREMEPFLGLPGNAGSLHAFGRRAAAAAELARERVAALVGAEDPQQIVFTSGATEACNAVLAQFEGGWISPFEHAAVREPALARGYRVLPNDGLSIASGEGSPWSRDVNLSKVAQGSSRAEGGTVGEGVGGLLAVMAVNNEIGARWDARALPADRRFVDATQALGKVPVDLADVDYAAFSAHKLYGPQGVGALFAVDGTLEPFQKGGEQEMGRRAGTLNVAGIVGFGAACALAADRMEDDYNHALKLRSIILEELDRKPQTTDRKRVNGGPDAVPHILSLSFLGLEGETLVVETDQKGYGISAGAACSSRSTQPSHVLTALGLPNEWRRGTVRISFGRANTPESTAELGRLLVRSVENLRTIG